MISATHSALSGLRAVSTAVEQNAHNTANLNTAGFKKGRTLFSEQPTGGVRASSQRVDTPGPAVAEQTARGVELVEQSNVDLVEEIPKLMVNTHSYSANLKTLQAADEMTGHLLDTLG
ncbi:flagellar basal body rod C-terminal domain-containing protein [Desulfogranum mediterraneum]|uniref:flagellar basal body rod C-terminal domain-containing protein n=1 Tax=Desulfogranum mediterraneum TaxID=160661 RepID=UPI000411249E|nr:flagellar basal body rod C-terminal domain-containing protein [Desulfogranum mediterraneum]